MTTYRVVLNGVLKGLDSGLVAPQLAAACKIPVPGALALLSKPGTVIKGDLTLELANAYKATLRGVGCQVIVEQEQDAGRSARSILAWITGKHGSGLLGRLNLGASLKALGRQARDALPGSASGGTQPGPAVGASGASRLSVPSRWQPALSWVSANVAKFLPRLGTTSRARKFLGVNTLIIASVAITAAAIAGVLVGTGPSTPSACPKDFQATDSMSCVGEMNFPNGEKYVGEVKDSQPHGRGTFTWPNGEKYVGEWKDGQRNGQGRFFWPDGTKYVGEFRNNKKHGKGTYTYANGRSFTGEWKDGNPVQTAAAGK